MEIENILENMKSWVKKYNTLLNQARKSNMTFKDLENLKDGSEVILFYFRYDITEAEDTFKAKGVIKRTGKDIYVETPKGTFDIEYKSYGLKGSDKAVMDSGDYVLSVNKAT